MFLATHWPDVDRFTPEGGWPVPEFDKVVHVCMYGLWMLLWWRILAEGSRAVRLGQIAAVLVVGLVWSAFDEISQAWVGRQPGIPDLMANVAAMLCVAAALYARQRLRSASVTTESDASAGGRAPSDTHF